MPIAELIADEFVRFHLEEDPSGRPYDFAEGLRARLASAGYEIRFCPVCPDCGNKHEPANPKK